nr:alpha/beta fold hydrolase [Candidatus Sigynarchaeota archaeon]
MDLEGMIWIVALSVVAAIFAILFVKNKVMYFSRMDMSGVVTRSIEIPARDITLHGKLILPRFVLTPEGKSKEKLPLIFVNHGWGASCDVIYTMENAVALAVGGPYAVLAYDCRGFGKSPGKRALTEQLFDDIPSIIDFGEKLSEIDPNRMGFTGMSMGGEIALTRAYVDKRIKAVVAICTPHDAKANFTRHPESSGARMQLGFLKAAGVNGKKIPDATNQKISPRYIIDKDDKALNDRVMLIHSATDELISPGEFEKNRQALGIDTDQAVLLQAGGHAFIHQELLVAANSLRFFKSKL